MNKLLERTLAEIVTNEEFLSQECETVDWSNEREDALKLITLLTTKAQILNGDKKIKCLGLAANQIGILKRVFVIRKKNGKYKGFVNPDILSASKWVNSTEGCYSRPGLQSLTYRADEIVVNASNLLSPLKLRGMEAHAFQHELDHLKGVLI